MAEKRMMTKKVTDDDNFMQLSASAQALYLHLMMSTDDDGFSNQVSISMFKAHASVSDLEALIEKRFILQFENGVIVIKHFRMANALRADRHKATAYQEELSRLALKENGSYTWLPNGCQMVANVSTNGCQMVADRLPNGCRSIDKNRLDKDRLDYIEQSEEPCDKKTETPNTKKPKIERHKHGEYQNVLLSDEEFAKLKEQFPDDFQARIEKLSAYMRSTGKTYKDHLATIRNWARMDKERKAERAETKTASNKFRNYTERDSYEDESEFYFVNSGGNNED